MLIELTLKNYFTVPFVSIHFEHGLNVISGETGAGKTVILQALFSLFGKSTTKPQDDASITATFDIKNIKSAKELLHKYGFNIPDNTIILRRAFHTKRARIFLNDTPTTYEFLEKLYLVLLCTHTQFASLFNATDDSHILRDFSNLDTSLVQNAYLQWKNVSKQLSTLKSTLDIAHQEFEFLTASIKEIDKLNPQTNEEAVLLEQRETSKIQETLTQLLQDIYSLMGTDPSIEHSLSRLVTCIEQLPEQITQKKALLESFMSSLVSFQEGNNLLESLSYQNDAPSLDYIEERLYSLRQIAEKHHTTIAELPKLKETLLNRRDDLSTLSTRMDKLVEQENTLQSAYIQCAEELFQAQQKAAERLCMEMKDLLNELKLPNARLFFQFTKQDKHLWSSNGMYICELFISLNESIEPKLLKKSVSGGELARITLALTVLSKEHIPTLIFDEIDAGTGGSVSSSIGKLLKRINGQVVSITHSPQIAAYADCHWLVEKKNSQTIYTHLMDEQAKEQEIARMLSGQVITTEAHMQARQLRQESP